MKKVVLEWTEKVAQEKALWLGRGRDLLSRTGGLLRAGLSLCVLGGSGLMLAPETAEAGVVIDEDFSSSASNFTVVSGGTWGVSGGRYVLSSPGTAGDGLLGNISVHDTSVSGDYAVTGIVRVVGSATAWNDMALIFGYQDSSNYYYVSLNESDDQYTKGVFKIVSGSPTEMYDLSGLSISADTDYEIIVDRVGSDIDVWVDSTLVASFSDSTFTGGQFGFGTKNDSAQFDDLIVEEPSSGGGGFSEDFSSGASDFTVVAGGTWGVSNGRYTVSSPANNTGDGLLGNISVHNTSVTGDYTVSAVVNFVGTSAPWNDAALIFGYQDSDNFYYVSLNESNDSYTKGILKIVNGTASEMADLGALSFSADVDYDLEVDRSGSSIVVRINDSQVASFTDATFAGGQFGFGTKNDSAEFDDLVVVENSSGGGQVAAPSFSPAPGNYGSAQNVTITSSTSGATIRYTTNGSTPTSSSGTVYTGAVNIGSTTTLKAIAYKSGMSDSSVTSGTYSISLGQVAAPSFSPSPGSYGSAQNVTITSSTSGATIRYTTNGSTPTSSSGTVYSGAVNISSTTTLKAIAYKSGMSDSSVTSGTYTISGIPPKPNASNTGPSGTLTTYTGSKTITVDNTVLEDYEMSGTIHIKANNVTIRNCRISGGIYSINCNYGYTGLLIEDCELKDISSAGVYGGNFTMLRTDIHDSDGDAVKPTTNCLIEQCWFHHLGKGEGAHADGVQSRHGGTNMTFRYNNFDMPITDPDPYKSNAAFILQDAGGPLTDVLIEYNWMNGGNYTIYTSGDTTIRNNWFGRDYRYGIRNGSYTEWSGNVWEDDGTPAP